MRVVCRVAVSLLLVSGVAFADSVPADFKAQVLDPPSTGPYPILSITSTAVPFPVSFTQCGQNELPGGNTADGCFIGVNNSGKDWTGLEFAFTNTVVLNSQPVSCAPAPNSNVFSQTNCALDTTAGPTGTYFLDFGGSGVIRNTESFFVTETGVPADLFPVGTGTVTSVTPEPSSLVLLLTGLPAAATALLRRARQGRRG